MPLSDATPGEARRRFLACGRASDEKSWPVRLQPAIRLATRKTGKSGRHPPAPPVAKESAAQLGQCLIHAGLITAEQLAEALRLQSEWGSRLGDLILAMGWVKPLDFYRVLAHHFDLEFVNLMEEPADDSLFDHKQYAELRTAFVSSLAPSKRRLMDRHRRSFVCRSEAAR